MAITRAQQAKQMLREGGRIGLFKGAQADTKQGKSMSPGTSAGGGSRFSGGDDRREQVSVARTQGKKTPTAQEVRNIVSEGPDDRGNVLQNRNQRNIVQYSKDLKAIDENKNLSTLQKFNAKRRLKNKQFINRKFTEKAQGIADYYGLSVEQVADLLDAYDRDLDEFDLSTFRGIVDAGAPPSIRSTDPNFLEAEMLDYSKRMSKIDPTTGKRIPLSVAELFSTTDPTTRINLPSPLLNKLQGDPSFSNLVSGLNRLKTLDTISQLPDVKQSDIDNYFNLTMGRGGIDPITGKEVDALFTRPPGGDRSNESDPCLGPNPPAYCAIRNQPKTPETPPVDPTMFRFMNRGGMVEDAPMGTGIMDLEAARQMMFLGGIAKGIKKGLKSVTRAAKKVFKSPFGKAALLAAPFVMGGGAGSFFGKGSLNPFLRKVAGDTAFSGLGEALSKIGLVNKSGGLTAGGIGSLFGITSLLAALQKPKEDENFDLESYYEKEGLSDFLANLGQRNRFLAEGGRIGLQEGGGIEQRLEQLGGDVTSAEQTLQEITQRLESAESNLGSGGGISGIGGIANINEAAIQPNMSRVPEGPVNANRPLLESFC